MGDRFIVAVVTSAAIARNLARVAVLRCLRMTGEAGHFRVRLKAFRTQVEDGKSRYPSEATDSACRPMAGQA
jgi:hypothetical protein